MSTMIFSIMRMKSLDILKSRIYLPQRCLCTKVTVKKDDTSIDIKRPKKKIDFNIDKKRVGEWEMIYSDTTIKQWALIVKLQLGLIAIVTLPYPYFYIKPSSNPSVVDNLPGLIAMSPILIGILFIYSRLYTRIVGRIAYHPIQKKIKLSTLTLLANRKDTIFDAEKLQKLRPRHDNPYSKVLMLDIKNVKEFKKTLFLQNVMSTYFDRPRVKELMGWCPPPQKN
ncbi:uncharacterized protein LOC141849282 [Brevipalpus obovatus]|uniref:uncharacterized protein LOC141849282 n=1 Tax=Brevipalpus obovatus TaxID=246614 RepID=UPI003D9F2F2A